MKKIIFLLLVSSLISGCGGPISMLTSSVGFVGSSDIYVRAYNGIDLSTTLITKKDIKTHLYETAKATVKIIESKNEVYEEKELPNTLIVKTEKVEEEVLIKTVKEKQSTTAFKLCYLSFCLAISIGVLMFVLGYGFLSLSRIKRPRKVKKKIKIRKRKIKKRKGRR